VTQFFGGSNDRLYYKNKHFFYNRLGMTCGGEYYLGGAYDDYNQFNGLYNRTLLLSFMDYERHWVLIFIRI